MTNLRRSLTYIRSNDPAELNRQFVEIYRRLDEAVGLILQARTDGTDTDAIHRSTGGEISTITEKTIPVAADLMLIEDSAASNLKKKLQIDNLDALFSHIGDVFMAVSDTQSHALAGTVYHEWTTEVRKDAGYTHSTSANQQNITIKNAGWYRVAYTLCFENADSDLISYRGCADIGGTEIPGSQSYANTQSATSGRYASVGTVFIVHATAGQVLRVFSQTILGAGNFPEVAATTTIANESSISIERVF